MPERQKAILVNASIIAGVILCYFRGYPLTVDLAVGLAFLILANALMYAKRRRLRTRQER